MADLNQIELPNGSTYSFKDDSAVANITRSGTTFTATKRDGTTFTFTQQDNDTKNTAGSTDTSSKIFLIGATSQAANPQTYSNSNIYATDGTLYAQHISIPGTLDSGANAVRNASSKNRVYQFVSSDHGYFYVYNSSDKVTVTMGGSSGAISVNNASGNRRGMLWVGGNDDGVLDLYDSSGTATISLTGKSGNINCTTINGHNIPTTLSESVTYSFNATTTLSYIGKSITCGTGTKIVRAYFRYVHSAPVETAVVRSSTSLGSYYCDVIAYGKDASSPCLTFIIKAGETFYFWARYSGNSQNNLDIHSVYIQDN